MDLCTSEGGHFLDRIFNVEVLMDAVLSITAKDQYLVGSEAIYQLWTGKHLCRSHPNIFKWSSAFSGLQVIVNQLTFRHRDSKSKSSNYNLLVSASAHTSA